MKDELIRDCLVVGIEDVTLLERLQTDEALTLDKAKKLAHQREVVKEQQSIRRNQPRLHNNQRKHARRQQKTTTENKINASDVANTLTQGKAELSSKSQVTSVEGMATSGQYMCPSKTVALVSEAPSGTEPVKKSYLNAVTDIANPQNPGTSESKSMAKQCDRYRG